TELSNRIASELEKEQQITTLKTAVFAGEGKVKNYTEDLSKLILKGNDAQKANYDRISSAYTARKDEISELQKHTRNYHLMHDEVSSNRITRFPELLRQMQEKYQDGNLTQERWNLFLLTYNGNVDECLQSLINST
ncbi:hypothetical protein, partial [Pantoea ananatis]